MKTKVRVTFKLLFLMHKFPKTTTVKFNSFAYGNTFFVIKYYKEKIPMMQ